MARKHRQPSTLNRSSSVGVVEFSARKLIIFALLELLVLSPFILITVDSFNGNMNNNQASALSSKFEQRFDFASSVNAKVNSLKTTNCTGDCFLTTDIQANASAASQASAADKKSAGGNSICKQHKIDANGERPYDDDLSSIGNASINNQSQRTISANDTKRAKREDAAFNQVDDGDDERVLSRKRRYLIFPPGSAIQLVFDSVHPIVGYSNYLILGITAAMAYELPSKPVYLDEELRESYEMGELPLLNRNDKNVTTAQYAIPSKKYSNGPNAIDSNYYYTNVPTPSKLSYTKNQFAYPYKTSYQTGYKPSYSAPNDRIDATNKLHQYVSYADNLMKQFKSLTEKIPQDRPLGVEDFQAFADILAKNVKNARKSDSKYAKKTHFKHFIHPAFKKRSIDELTPLEKFDLNLHRNSRHALYKKINTFLQTQGSDGNECILKMLCETGQRKRDEAPGSMVVELLRTVFTLPEPLSPTQHLEHKRYDEAHATEDDCQRLYPKCKDSVWNPKYM